MTNTTKEVTFLRAPVYAILAFVAFIGMEWAGLIDLL